MAFHAYVTYSKGAGRVAWHFVLSLMQRTLVTGTVTVLATLVLQRKICLINDC